MAVVLFGKSQHKLVGIAQSL